MKTRSTCVLLFIQLIKAQLVFKNLKEGQSLGLSLVPQQDQSSLAGIFLYHRDAHSQTTLLCLTEGKELQVDPELQARLQFYGGLNSLKINVSISGLQQSDSGLYIWELSYRDQNSSDHFLLDPQKIFLQVEDGSRWHYIPMIITMAAASGLLLLTLGWMLRQRCVNQHPSKPHVPIYEEMSRKTPEDTQRVSFQLEEIPAYSSPNLRPIQENHYACPRQLTLRP